MRCAVISDDLTGAHNIGVEFAQYGLNTVIAERPRPDADVMIVNTDSRYMARDAAYEGVHRAVSSLAPDVWVKKIDSLLRGNIGAEIDALLDAVGLDRCLVAVASPKLGRTTVGGYQLHNGVPIHQVSHLDPSSTLKTAYIPDVIRAQSQREVYTEHTTHEKAGIYVADAATTQQLCNVVVKAHERGVRCFAGTYGLGEAVCRVIAPPVQPVLVVVGSFSRISQAQARVLAQRPDCAYLPFDPQRDTWDTLRDNLSGAVQAQQNPVMHITGELDVNTETQKQLVTTFAPAMDAFGGFVATGGATAHMLLQLLGAEALSVHPVELFPGTPAATLIGGPHAGKAFLAKPGAQGDDSALETLLQHAQTIQRTQH